ncbi:3-dehydroquinate synthase [Geodermatophilus sabuli]|uniref:3-dehydroquinate synthase n=1 Tax=Geodermatophilus sabuli TaxID=1564158 RepID=A0A285E8J2_9ACTN|nr:3-dehydroquinate synthase [Geodermatophilus sabuli]
MSGQGREPDSEERARSGAARGNEPVARGRVTVRGERPYDVVIGPGAQAELGVVLAGTPRAAVVHAPPLAALAGAAVETLQTAGVAAEAVVVPDGEAAKTAEVAAGAWEEFGRLGLTRSDAVVGVGGGAVTDLAGFLAATWVRGVRVVHLPTSLLGMVDAAVGGKTGINTGAGKNLVGAFHPPAAVLADTDVLPGLPEAEFRSGLAEVVKCGFIADGAILDLLDADPTGRRDTAELIERAVRVKADAVGEDLLDTGVREFLNYGHTLAHAIERVEDFGWRHGEAVAVGLVFAAELAGRAGLLSRAEVARHRELVAAMGLPTRYDGDWARLQSVMRVDKKARGASLRFVVLDGLGNPRILTDPDQAWLDAAWAAVSARPTPTASEETA